MKLRREKKRIHHNGISYFFSIFECFSIKIFYRFLSITGIFFFVFCVFFLLFIDKNIFFLKPISSIYREFSDILKLKKENHIAKFIPELIKNDYNSYDVFSLLLLAKESVNENKLDNAALLLQKSLQNTDDIDLRAIIQLRLARVQLELNKISLALETLSHVKVEAWRSMVFDIKGEALLRKNKKEKARIEWNKSLEFANCAEMKKIIREKLSNVK